MPTLLCNSAPAWVNAVLNDFDAFLLDHAACERKASAMAMTFVVRYPDRDAILEPMINLAREELTHFHRVFKILQSRGLRFKKDEKDPYMKGLMPRIKKGREDEFLDRLVMAGVVEARGCERFAMIAEALHGKPLHAFYDEIARSESRHADLFIDLARHYFPDDQVDERVQFWLESDAEIIQTIPVRAALH